MDIIAANFGIVKLQFGSIRAYSMLRRNYKNSCSLV